ncbi:MAG TPA: DUF5668 domain-containing protein [Acidimicrobiales bacterium]|nr:DUF5668 domain-containing protein [Acidimicrobiales bacterium]
MAGCIFLVLGAALFLDNVGIIDLQTSAFVPLVIVAVGIGVIVLAVSRVVPTPGSASTTRSSRSGS